MSDGREARGDRTQLALLAAARRAFARVGHAGASVRDIAADAGVNPALVRYHFGSKDELYRRVIDDAMAGLRDRMAASVSSARDPRDAARRAMSAYVDHLEADPDFPKLIARGVLDGDPEIERIAVANLAPLLGAAAAVGGDREAVLTAFAAAVVPFLYAPLIAKLFGEDPLSPGALAARRRHLETLVDRMLP